MKAYAMNAESRHPPARTDGFLQRFEAQLELADASLVHLSRKLADELREGALDHLVGDQRYADLARIPVALLPTEIFNGQVVLTPKDEPLILLDSGVMRRLTELVHLFLGYYTWTSGEYAHCKDHSQHDFAVGLGKLAIVILSGRDELMETVPGRLDSCPSIERDPLAIERLVFFKKRICEFVLLHEYGHVVLGHVKQGNRQVLRVHGAPVTAVMASRAAEYEADGYAVRALARTRDAIAGKPNKAVNHVVGGFTVPVGIFFRFVDFIEALVEKVGASLPACHPPASQRWNQIRSGLSRADETRSVVKSLDYYFDELLKIFKVAPMGDRLG